MFEVLLGTGYRNDRNTNRPEVGKEPRTESTWSLETDTHIKLHVPTINCDIKMDENSMDGQPSRRKLCTFEACTLKVLNKDGDFAKIHNKPVNIAVWSDNETQCSVDIQDGDQSVLSFAVTRETGHYHAGEKFYIFNLKDFSPMICFPKKQDVVYFNRVISDVTGSSKESVFSERTEESSAVQYFQFYGYLSQQQNMMQDYIRTSTYQKAMLQNEVDFKDKVVLDVGAGTGILSFFAIQSGAKKVYAVEASTMAIHCEVLTKANGLKDKLQVIAGKLEEVEIPEKVDMIISEPMGYMLVNERMLESFLHAKKWLKPEGKMFPSQGNLYVAPFMDDALYMEHYSKANFWFQPSFYGVNLTQLREKAVEEYFKQPIVDTFDVQILLAKPITHTINFLTSTEEDLHKIHIPLNFTALTAGNVHGLAFWFDVAFHGSTRSVWLSTAPQEPLTHWYQVRCLLPHPVHVRTGQILRGHVLLVANKKQSYDVEIEITVDGSNIISRNVLDLKNPYFRYTGAQTNPPTGSNTTSPTETYWSSIPNNVGSSLNIGNHELAAGGVLSNGVVPSNAGFGMGGVNTLGLQGQVLTSGGMLVNGMPGSYIVGNHGPYSMHGGSGYAENTSGNVMQR